MAETVGVQHYDNSAAQIIVITANDNDSIVQDSIVEEWSDVATEQIIVETPIDGDTTEVVTMPVIEIQTTETSEQGITDGDDVSIQETTTSIPKSSKNEMKSKLMSSHPTRHQDNSLINGIEVPTLDPASHFEAWTADSAESGTHEDNLLGLEGQQFIFVAQQPDTNSASTQTELCMRAATKRERDRLKKRELRKCPEFREREKERARMRMRAKRQDSDYRTSEREKDRKRRRMARQRNALIRSMERERDKQWKKIVRSVTGPAVLTEIEMP
ncbi:uncharacterized protein LOC100368701 [Saccoglossus kowalevskii]|uniref:RNA-binding protein 25-like n=1 Tax=Saccoglossus kowalevskii TaxID=10224 RepID=A0ABM0H0J4_SACKO|nr:PREDICTED: RNA-binding protein 25-like [Saccoglossus kowalevskii]